MPFAFTPHCSTAYSSLSHCNASNDSLISDAPILYASYLCICSFALCRKIPKGKDRRAHSARRFGKVRREEGAQNSLALGTGVGTAGPPGSNCQASAQARHT